jgi:hypothetical protein
MTIMMLHAQAIGVNIRILLFLDCFVDGRSLQHMVWCCNILHMGAMQQHHPQELHGTTSCLYLAFVCGAVLAVSWCVQAVVELGASVSFLLDFSLKHCHARGMHMT